MVRFSELKCKNKIEAKIFIVKLAAPPCLEIKVLLIVDSAQTLAWNFYCISMVMAFNLNFETTRCFVKIIFYSIISRVHSTGTIFFYASGSCFKRPPLKDDILFEYKDMINDMEILKKWKAVLLQPSIKLNRIFIELNIDTSKLIGGKLCWKKMSDFTQFH